ncbi:MAG TPA: tetratricopeptide repeat protein, partial [Chitinivibrionales bacterium]
AGAWVLQTIQIKRKTAHEFEQKSSATQQLTAYFEKKSRDLLPVDIEAHEFSAQYYLKNDQPQKAIEHILRILPVQNNNKTLKVDLATAYLQSAQYRAAFEEFTKLSETDTADEHSASIAARLGLTLFYLGKIKESVETLKACIVKYPRCAEAMCYLGEVDAATSEAPQRAEAYFQKALDMDPGYVEAWYQRARFCMSQNDYLHSREYLLKILEIEPLNVKTHARLGMAYYYLNEPEMAKKAYQTALALNPSDYNTHYNLGELYYSKYNDSASALSEFKKALEGNPKHAEANFKTGVICLGNNMFKEAVGYLESAREASPKNIRVLLQLGVAYERLDMKDEALAVYRSIIELDALNQVARQKIKLLASG